MGNWKKQISNKKLHHHWIQGLQLRLKDEDIEIGAPSPGKLASQNAILLKIIFSKELYKTVTLFYVTRSVAKWWTRFKIDKN